MKDLPTVTFAPGGRAACVKGMTWLLVDCSLTHPMVLEAWGVIDRGGSVDEVVGAILSHGMTSAPDFALVAATGEGDLRFVVRGAVAASLVVAGATEELSAHGILTDQTRSGVQGFVLHGSGERVPASLPVVAGILPVDCLSVVLEATDPADSALSAEAAPAAVTAAPEVAAVQPEAEVAAQPELQAEADAKAEPTVAPETAAQSPQPAASASVDDPEVLASIREYERPRVGRGLSDGRACRGGRTRTLPPGSGAHAGRSGHRGGGAASFARHGGGRGLPGRRPRTRDSVRRRLHRCPP
jgi:hypothetical protein